MNNKSLDEFVKWCSSQPILAVSLLVVLVVLVWPELLDQLLGVLQLTGMHWGQLWTRAGSEQELDADLLEDDPRFSDEDEDAEAAKRKRALVAGKSRNGTSGHIYPGLVNAGGNACFLNAAVQSMAAVEPLVPYLRGIVRMATYQNARAPVATALLDLIIDLTRPSTSRSVLRPQSLALALFNSSESRQHLMNAEQQDAHEFFVMLTEAVNDELDRLERGSRQASEATSFGLQTIGSEPPSSERSHLKDPFESLMARRVSCVSCRYTENVVHYHEEHLTLNVPFARSCTLQDMLDDYVKLDIIDERICSKCSLLATIERIDTELKELDPTWQGAKKRRKQLSTLRAALELGQYDSVPTALLDRAERPATKQAMFSRPPKALAIHLVRSSIYRGGTAIKNSCRVATPGVLDLTAFTTGAALNTRPESSMGPSVSTKVAARYQYRLVSVVEHYGSHSYGHYIAYTMRGREWFRISDETVNHAYLEDALDANPFLLFYERIEDMPPPQIPFPASSPNKTRPRLVQRHGATSRPSSAQGLADLVKS